METPSSTQDGSSSQKSAQKTATVSVLIICVDRVDDLVRGLASLELIDDLVLEIRVLKNAPSVEWKKDLFDGLPESIRAKLTILPVDKRLSCAASRNYLFKGSKGDTLFLLDDDAYVLERSGIDKGLEILQRNGSTVGAIAYPQCNSKGEIIKEYTQPAPVNYSCITNGFTGFGNLLRSSVYGRLGGFQELLEVFGEENEYCRRQLDVGYVVVYLPLGTICHAPSEIGRNTFNRARLEVRNSWYVAILQEPLWILWFSLPRRILMGRSHLKSTESWPGSTRRPLFREALSDLFRDLPQLLRRRSPLKVSTLKKWQEIKDKFPAYS